MKMNDEDKRSVLEGLDLLIETKKLELLAIRSKTESDYQHLSGIHELIHKSEMNWKEKQLEDVLAKQKEIEEIHSLYTMYNSSRNQVLVVPHTVKINMNITN